MFAFTRAMRDNLSPLRIRPPFATDILHGHAETLGLLLGASAAGALFGSLLIAPLVLCMRRIGAVVSIAVIWVGGWFALFACSTFLPFSLLCLVCTGLGTTVVVTMVVGLSRHWLLRRCGDGCKASC
jgi:hypothetical protein